MEELIATGAVQRLKKIHQAGASYLVADGRDGNRFDHSVGVMRLIQLLGGTLEEQIAGLLHDVSYTAFSHVVDYVVFNEDETFHEEYKDWIIDSSGIPELLTKYQLDIKRIFIEHNWKILEQPAPDLCADRINYTLRDMLTAGRVSKAAITDFVDAIAVRDNKIIVSNPTQAAWFTKQYHDLVTSLFMAPSEIYANHHMAAIIRDAISHQIISFNDMRSDDDEGIRRKIVDSANEQLKIQLNSLQKGIKIALD